MSNPNERYMKELISRKLSLLDLAGVLQNASKASAVMGYSRSHYYNIKKRFHEEGMDGLRHKSRAPVHRPNKANNIQEKEILDYLLEHPDYSYQRISDSLFVERGIRISVGVVRGVLTRKGLTRFKDRLRYLETEQQKSGFELTEEQAILLSRITDKVDSRHIYAPFAGYLLSQDTFYVGHMKGVGRIYMQSLIDCSTRFAFAKLYTSKDALTAAHILQDQLLPYYKSMGIVPLNILTDNGTEYCGLPDHPYELLLEIFSIHHRTTKIKSPWTNGFVERFHKTVLNEFFQRTFRIKFYLTLEELQNDLNEYMIRYNFYRGHRGYNMGGKTPYEAMQVKRNRKELPMVA